MKKHYLLTKPASVDDVVFEDLQYDISNAWQPKRERRTWPKLQMRRHRDKRKNHKPAWTRVHMNINPHGA